MYFFKVLTTQVQIATYMLNPELSNDDVMYTAVNILPGICLVMPVTQNNDNNNYVWTMLIFCHRHPNMA